jgi:hypothetical protein
MAVRLKCVVFVGEVLSNRIERFVHDILISALQGLIDALYVQANARMSVRPEYNGRDSHGRACAGMLWHSLV